PWTHGAPLHDSDSRTTDSDPGRGTAGKRHPPAGSSPAQDRPEAGTDALPQPVLHDLATSDATAGQGQSARGLAGALNDAR
ncbi:hypothetical protein, partial [Pseudoalteromonas sp. SIMBA_162]|uniref:hypothetical protein n=1 Tax=Pseudoalteromonas sp. SIMBA_162 TaxID=3080867 RepID=UPI00397CBEB2